MLASAEASTAVKAGTELVRTLENQALATAGFFQGDLLYNAYLNSLAYIHTTVYAPRLVLYDGEEGCPVMTT